MIRITCANRETILRAATLADDANRHLACVKTWWKAPDPELIAAQAASDRACRQLIDAYDAARRVRG